MAYIRLIEEMGNQLLLLRPRRFGKSVLLSMLENYIPRFQLKVALLCYGRDRL